MPRKSTTSSPSHEPLISVRPSSYTGSHVRLEPSIAVKLPGGHRAEFTRRQFIQGVAGVAGVAALAGGGYAISKAVGGSSGPSTLQVSEQAVFSSEDCTRIEDSSSVMSLATRCQLPYGTLVWSNDDTLAACLLPTEEASPLVQVALLSLDSGSYSTVLSQSVGHDEKYEIYDARANSHGLVWVESNILDGRWRVYGAPLEGSGLGEAQLLDENDSSWEMPMLAAAGNYAWWQLRPTLGGPAITEASLLKRAHFGDSSSEEVYSSNGRMASPPYAGADSVTITPRADRSGTYYQLTRLDAESGAVTDTMTLPSSMAPLEAGYGPNGFNFSFENIYNYGGGIANLGTYTPLNPAPKTLEKSGDATTNTTAYSDSDWFRFARTPSAPPAWCDSWFLVKSRTAVCGVNLSSREYFALPTESGTDDYGDYLASTGAGHRFVTYSNIDYTPLEGEPQKHCLVRVWQPVKA